KAMNFTIRMLHCRAAILAALGLKKIGCGGGEDRRPTTARSCFSPFAISLCCYLAASVLPLHAAPVEVAAEKHVSVVRVNITNQGWDFLHPWTKHAPISRRALGAVLQDKRVLVSAELVANANYVELEKAESGEKTAATVDAVDYEANLALLKPTEDTFLNGIPPLA